MNSTSILDSERTIDSFYKHIQPNCTCPHTNIKFIVPLLLLFISQHDITNDCGVIVISHKQNLPVSNLSTTTQVDTTSNNDDDKNEFFHPKKNHNTLKYMKQQK